MPSFMGEEPWVKAMSDCCVDFKIFSDGRRNLAGKGDRIKPEDDVRHITSVHCDRYIRVANKITGMAGTTRRIIRARGTCL
jgi:hypothetical protein